MEVDVDIVSIVIFAVLCLSVTTLMYNKRYGAPNKVEKQEPKEKPGRYSMQSEKRPEVFEELANMAGKGVWGNKLAPDANLEIKGELARLRLELASVETNLRSELAKMASERDSLGIDTLSAELAKKRSVYQGLLNQLASAQNRQDVYAIPQADEVADKPANSALFGRIMAKIRGRVEQDGRA